MTVVVTNLGSLNFAGGAHGANLAVSANCLVGTYNYVCAYESYINASSGTFGAVVDDAGNTYTRVTGVQLSTLGGVSVFQGPVTTQLNSAQNITYNQSLGQTTATLLDAFNVTNVVSPGVDSGTTATLSYSSATPAALNSGVPSRVYELFLALHAYINTGTTNLPVIALDTGNGWTTPPPASLSNNNGTGITYGWSMAGGIQINKLLVAAKSQPTWTAGGGTNFGAGIILGIEAQIPPATKYFNLKPRLRR